MGSVSMDGVGGCFVGFGYIPLKAEFGRTWMAKIIYSYSNQCLYMCMLGLERLASTATKWGEMEGQTCSPLVPLRVLFIPTSGTINLQRLISKEGLGAKKVLELQLPQTTHDDFAVYVSAEDIHVQVRQYDGAMQHG